MTGRQRAVEIGERRRGRGDVAQRLVRRPTRCSSAAAGADHARSRLTATSTWSPAPAIASAVANVSAAVVASSVTVSAVVGGDAVVGVEGERVGAGVDRGEQPACTTVAPATHLDRLAGPEAAPACPPPW